ncbi:MAG: ferredoxin [bacterium]|nr:ferredoxin [bacterium]
MKIKIDRNLCIGAGSCSVIAPNTFELDDELKAVVKNPEGDPRDTIIDAAKSCPVLAILLEEDDGTQIYP